MKIGLYTSRRFLELKEQALAEAIKKLGIEAEIVHNENMDRPPSPEQAFGFEELFQRAKLCAAEAFQYADLDVGIGIENSLSFIYSADEWYYVICVALQTKDGATTASFTPGISVPVWMIKEVQDGKIKIGRIDPASGGRRRSRGLFLRKNAYPERPRPARTTPRIFEAQSRKPPRGIGFGLILRLPSFGSSG